NGRVKHRISSLLFVLSSLAGLAPASLALEAEEWVCSCGKHHFLPPPTGDVPGRKYARDRLIDVLHLKLDVTPDFHTRSIAGTATLEFTPIARPLLELRLDAVSLDVSKVEVIGAELAEYQ